MALMKGLCATTKTLAFVSCLSRTIVGAERGMMLCCFGVYGVVLKLGYEGNLRRQVMASL